MEDRVVHLPAREIAIRELNSLRGRLCAVVESAGLPLKQERAIVTLLKNLSFQNQAVIERLLTELDDGRLFPVVGNRLSLPDKNGDKPTLNG